jgi:hypothetical protein
VFKWACLLVAVIALSAFGWMLNDIRMEVKGLAPKADKLLAKADELLAKTDAQLPRILAQTEQLTAQLDRHLPRILAQTEQAAGTINTQLPTLLARSEVAIDNVADLSENFKQYKGLMGIVHAATQDKGLFSYGTGLLSWLGGHDATIGVRPAGSSLPLRQPVPAKQWAAAARPDAQFLSLVAKSKEDVLHGLARTKSPAPWHIQLPGQAPRLLADWLKETHPESKGLN